MFLFMRAARLRNANVHRLPTYPSRAPRMELDFVLYGDGIEVDTLQVPPIPHSDHLPLICDFNVR